MLSLALEGLFPCGVVAADLRGTRRLSFPEAQALLSEEERRSLGSCVLVRLQDFAAGRACARHALAALGVHGYALLGDSDRAPIWPAGHCGSITHTEDYSAAVVGESMRCGSLGLDAEVVEDVEPRLWARLGTQAELSQLEQVPEALRRRAAALMFAAKESFYKAQWPKAQESLAFADIEIEYDEIVLERGGAFRVRACRALRSVQEGEVATGRCRFDERLVIAGMALPGV